MSSHIGHLGKITGGNWYEDKGHENVKNKPHTYRSRVRGHNFYIISATAKAAAAAKVAKNKRPTLEPLSNLKFFFIFV